MRSIGHVICHRYEAATIKRRGTLALERGKTAQTIALRCSDSALVGESYCLDGKLRVAAEYPKRRAVSAPSAAVG